MQIKADVETQGEFVESLAAEVRAAAYTDIEDVVDFVNWLDDELSFLVLCIFILFKNLLVEKLFGQTCHSRILLIRQPAAYVSYVKCLESQAV